MFQGLFKEIVVITVLISPGKHQQKLLLLVSFFPAFPTTTFTPFLPVLLLFMQQCHFPLSTHFIHILDEKAPRMDLRVKSGLSLVQSTDGA